MNIIILNSPRLLALFLLPFICEGCLDFQEVRMTGDKGVNLAPVIDKRYVSPEQSIFLKQVPLAQNCRAIEFKIPSLRDFNKNDKLYYLWFFDRTLLPPFQGVIEPENRDGAIITMKLDRQKIEDAVGKTPLDQSFFESSHLIEFVVSDRRYVNPESRYSDDPVAYEDSTHWSIWFSNTPCSQ